MNSYYSDWTDDVSNFFVPANKAINEALAPAEEAVAKALVQSGQQAEERVTAAATKEAGEKAYAGTFSSILLVGAVGLGLWLLLRKR